MRSAAATVAQRGAAIIDLNMGCPVPKVCKTGAGAALHQGPGHRGRRRAGGREGSGLPVTVKLRSGQKPGETDGFDLAHRLVAEAGVAAIGFHPRSAAVHHKGGPTTTSPPSSSHAAGARDPHRRPARPRGGPGGIRAHRRGRRDARPRLARQPVAVRGAARRAHRKADRRRDPRRARLDDGRRRRALRRRARGPLAAQGLPLVHGAPRARARSLRRACRRPIRSPPHAWS